MNWVRCRKCGTFGEPVSDVRCFGCGEVFPEAIANANRTIPEVRRVARRDSRASSITLRILAIFGTLGIFTIAMQFERNRGLGVVVVVGVIIALVMGFLSMRGEPQGKFNTAGRVVLMMLASVGVIVLGIVALGVGLFILILIVCAGSGSSFH